MSDKYRPIEDVDTEPDGESTWLCYDCDSDGPFETVWYPAGDADVQCLKCMSLNTGEPDGRPSDEDEGD